LPIVTFRLKSFKLSPQQLAAAHGSIVEEVTSGGRRWISQTMVDGQSVIRMMVISYLTEERHLQDLELVLTRAARHLSSRAKVG
jgi:glutamate/tyrosine decarboxylase-like PLP-dependent enzyme